MKFFELSKHCFRDPEAKRGRKRNTVDCACLGMLTPHSG